MCIRDMFPVSGPFVLVLSPIRSVLTVVVVVSRGVVRTLSTATRTLASWVGAGFDCSGFLVLTLGISVLGRTLGGRISKIQSVAVRLGGSAFTTGSWNKRGRNSNAPINPTDVKNAISIVR